MPLPPLTRRLLLHVDSFVAIFACVTFVEWNIVFTIRAAVPWFVLAVPLLTLPLCLAATLWSKAQLERGS
jgi:hypothetical protein